MDHWVRLAQQRTMQTHRLWILERMAEQGYVALILAIQIGQFLMIISDFFFHFHFNFQGGFSNSGGQTYNLPNGQTLSITHNNGASFNPFGRPSTSQGSSIAFGG